jgi:tetratricopeptide (TPR) repeat protein
VLVNLADVIDAQGEYEAARERYEEAIDITNASGDIWPAAYAMAAYGQAAARHGDQETARTRYEQALALYRQMGDQRAEARVMTLLADLVSDEGDEAHAREMLYDALRIRCGLGDAPGICAALERFSAATQGVDAVRATRILAAAAAMRDRTGARLSLSAQADVDQQLSRLQTELGAEFARVWQQGSGASVDDALRDAAAVVDR